LAATVLVVITDIFVMYSKNNIIFVTNNAKIAMGFSMLAGLVFFQILMVALTLFKKTWFIAVLVSSIFGAIGIFLFSKDEVLWWVVLPVTIIASIGLRYSHRPEKEGIERV
jgi:hypothetical protein